MSICVTLELATNDAEALLRHAQEHVPATGDFRENAHLREALASLASAILQAESAVSDRT